MKRGEMTVKEYAELQGVHERTVRRWIATGRTPFRRTDGVGIRIMPTVSQNGSMVVVMPSLRDQASE